MEEAVIDADVLLLALIDGVADAAAELVTESDKLPLAVELNDALCEDELVDEADGDTLSLSDALCVGEALAELEAVALPLSDGDTEGVAECVAVNDSVELTLGVRLGVTVTLGVRLGDALPDALALAVRLGETVVEGVLVEEAEGG